MSGVVLNQGNYGYTILSGTATTTLASGAPLENGALWGFLLTGTGSAATVVSALDVVVAGTKTSTNTLVPLSTLTAVGAGAGPAGSGPLRPSVRYQGTLLAVIAGAANSTVMALWD